MEQSKKNIMRISAMTPVSIEQAIEIYNKLHKTNFKLVEVFYDEILFCDIEYSNVNIQDFYSLGYLVSTIERKMKDKGEIDW